MKKWLFFLAFPVLFLGGCSLSKKSTEIERSEKIDKPISHLLEQKEEFECFVFDGDLVSRIRAKGEKVKIDGFFNNLGKDGDKENNNLFADGNFVFIWKMKNGLKYDLSKVRNLLLQDGDKAAKIARAISASEWARELENRKLKYDCKKASIPDEYFVIPKEVGFVGFDEQGENQGVKNGEVGNQEPQDKGEEIDQEIIEDPEVE